MSAKTRIKRPTTATPRKPKLGTLVHQATHYHTVDTPEGPRTLKAKGTTLRKAKG